MATQICEQRSSGHPKLLTCPLCPREVHLDPPLVPGRAAVG